MQYTCGLSLWKITVFMSFLAAQGLELRGNRRFNPLNALAETVRLATGEANNAVAAPPPPQVPAMPPLNLTPEEIGMMESGAAATKQENMKISKDLNELSSEVESASSRMLSLKDQGELDKQKASNFQKFEENVSASALLSSLDSMGTTDKSNGLFEAPIVLLEPAASTLAERLALDQAAQCKGELHKDFQKMKKVAKEFENLTDPEEIQKEIEKLENSFKEVQETRSSHEKEKEQLTELIDSGDAKAEKQLKTIEKKVKDDDVQLEEIRLKLTALRRAKKEE